MSLFGKKPKHIEPLLRVVIDFDDYNDPEAEINPYGRYNQHWEIGAPNVVSVERVDGLLELTRVEYDHGIERPERKPGEIGTLADLYGRRFITSKTTVEFAEEHINECGILEALCGLDELCDVSNLERLVVIGRMWSSAYNTPSEGWDCDFGFDVEAVEEVIVNV